MNYSKSSREIISILESDGWYLCRSKGGHCQYKHPCKKGTVTVPHPRKDFPKKTIKSIFTQAKINL